MRRGEKTVGVNVGSPTSGALSSELRARLRAAGAAAAGKDETVLPVSYAREFVRSFVSQVGLISSRKGNGIETR